VLTFEGLGVVYTNTTMLYKKNYHPLMGNRSDILEFLKRDDGEMQRSPAHPCLDHGSSADAFV
jgi:hypothetical protein